MSEYKLFLEPNSWERPVSKSLRVSPQESINSDDGLTSEEVAFRLKRDG